MSEPEPMPEIKHIEIADDFHDLLHHWWQGCDDLPLHFRHWREFIWTPRWRSWTLCRVGRHSRLGATWQHGRLIGYTCAWCGRCWADRDGKTRA